MKKDNKKETAKAMNEGRPGYKHTPLGWIPEDWEIKKLDQIVSQPIVYGIVQAGPHIENGIPYIRSSDVGGDIRINDLGKTSVPIALKYKRSEVKPGDIVFSLRGNIGEISVVPSTLLSANLTQGTARISVNKDILSKYIFYALKSSVVIKNINHESKGSTFKEISLEKLRTILLPLPKLKNQIKISNILSTWDSAITKTQQFIEQLKQRNKGLMQALLTGKKGWHEKRLSDIFQRVVEKNTVGNTNVVTISAQRGFVKQDDFFKKLVASDILDNYFLVKKGDFCYNKSYSNGYDWGAIKRLNDFDQAVVTTLYICFRLRTSNEYSCNYFEYFFDANLLDKGLAKIAHEGGRAHGLLNVTPSDFFELKILVPPYKDQIKIYNILSTANDELKMAIEKLNWLVGQKKGLMQKLLSGEIRTKN